MSAQGEAVIQEMIADIIDNNLVVINSQGRNVAKSGSDIAPLILAALSAPSPAATVAEGSAEAGEFIARMEARGLKVVTHGTMKECAEHLCERWGFGFSDEPEQSDRDTFEASMQALDSVHTVASWLGYCFTDGPAVPNPAPSGPADARVKLMGIADDFRPDRPQDAQLALDEMRAAIQALVDDIAVWNVHLAKADLMAKLNTLSEVKP